jgi:hypothetical protein
LIMGGVADALCERGTLPLYYALVRYWSDHPRHAITGRYSPNAGRGL